MIRRKFISRRCAQESNSCQEKRGGMNREMRGEYEEIRTAEYAKYAKKNANAKGMRRKNR